MDMSQALLKAQELLDLLEESYEVRDVRDVRRPIDDRIKKALPLVQRIAANLEPGLAKRMQPHSTMGEWPWFAVRDATVRLVGLIESSEEAAAILSPTGPKLSATRLHPWVWEGAARLWDDGHRRAAIENAALAVEIQVKAKLERFDVTGKDLMPQAFSSEPPKPGAPRLRLPGFTPGTPDYTSAHEGAQFLGMGVMLGIRNLATHRLEEPEEQVALEQLAALSVIARWVDAAMVVT
jgi:hypothetical protein